MTCATYSTFCELQNSHSIFDLINPVDGRRKAYLFAFPLLCIGSAIVTFSRAVPELLVGRFIQAFGASCGFSVGAAIIGDMFKIEERGTALGIFSGVHMNSFSQLLAKIGFV